MSTSYNALTNAIMLEENSSYANNPGALMENGAPVQFPDLQSGIDALTSKINFDLSGKSSVYSPDESLSQFENTYTGGDPNAANNIASMLGVSPSTPVGQLNDASVTPQTSFWQRVKNYMSDALSLSGTALQNAVGSPMGTPTPQNPYPVPASTPTTPQKQSPWGAIPVDAVAVLIGIILLAISVFGLQNIKSAATSAVKVAA